MSLKITKKEWERICKGKTCGYEFGTGFESTKCPIAYSCTKKVKLPKNQQPSQIVSLEKTSGGQE